MAKVTFEQHLKTLISQNPNWCDDLDNSVSFLDYHLLDLEKFSKHDAFEEWWHVNRELNGKNEILKPTQEDLDTFGGHPGGLDSDSSIDALAFYLPFHLYPEKWGIYVTLDGVKTVHNALSGFFATESMNTRTQFELSSQLLVQHEMFHHKTEMFVTRLEAILRHSCYKQHTMPRYMQVLHPPHGRPSECYEEICANSFARQEVKLKFSNIKGKINKPAVLGKAINDFFETMPASYSAAALTNDDNWVIEQNKLFEDYLVTCHNAGSALPSGNSSSIWDINGHWALRNDSIKDRIFLIQRMNSQSGISIPEDMCNESGHLMAFAHPISPIELSTKFQKKLKKIYGLEKAWNVMETKLSDGTYSKNDLKKWGAKNKKLKDLWSVRVEDTDYGAHRAHIERRKGKPWLAIDIDNHDKMGHGK